jgi:predicted chitinase
MIELTQESLRAVFPRAPQAVIDAFVAKQDVLTRAGINATRMRLSYFLANIEHECGGFTIRSLTENVNYTAERMADVWENRFPREPRVKGRGDPAKVRAKYGTAAGWQLKAFDDIYGNRMGNRPGTHDGSTYIGRGGPQWTGRDGYEACAARTGIPAVNQPQSVSQLDLQPEICAAFWAWKGLNAKADAGDFKGCVKIWNGGTNGLADREHLMAGNDPIIARMKNVDRILPIAVSMPGKPPTMEPPKDVIDAATSGERKVRNAAATIGAAGAGSEAARQSGSEAHFHLPTPVAVGCAAVAVAIALVAAALIARKRLAVIANWF